MFSLLEILSTEVCLSIEEISTSSESLTFSSITSLIIELVFLISSSEGFSLEEESENRGSLTVLLSIFFLKFLLVISECSVICSSRDITLLTFFLKHHLHQFQCEG
ncbi:hypothetical protein [Fusobacterium varium]|jgi:hypothetical protein